MAIKEIEAKTLLNKQKRIDSWFISGYGMNLYRGCLHNCAYCDGRAESYYVEGEFGKDVSVKINAPELLEKALNPKRKRKPLKRAFILLGGGVGDSYQGIEKKYSLARKSLEIIERFNLPVHVLTKSCLVERDMDILQRIHKGAGAILSMSFSSGGDQISRILEPGSDAPSRRLKTLARFKQAGIPTGMFLMPVIPYVTDSAKRIEKTVEMGKNADVDFILFSGMTLKPGAQKNHFLKVIEGISTKLPGPIESLYTGDKWGGAMPCYYREISKRFAQAAKKFGVAQRVPPRLYRNVLDENDRAIVILQSLDYLTRQIGLTGSFRTAAKSIANLGLPLSLLNDRLDSLPGASQLPDGLLCEIVETGTSTLLESML